MSTMKTSDLSQIQTIVWNDLAWIDISFPAKAETEYLAHNYHFQSLRNECRFAGWAFPWQFDHFSYPLRNNVSTHKIMLPKKE
jgi:hypothetical protein